MALTGAAGSPDEPQGQRQRLFPQRLLLPPPPLAACWAQPSLFHPWKANLGQAGKEIITWIK